MRRDGSGGSRGASAGIFAALMFAAMVLGACGVLLELASLRASGISPVRALGEAAAEARCCGCCAWRP